MKTPARLLRLFFSACLLMIFNGSLIFSQEQPVASDSWAQVKRSGKGSITIYWCESRPFIYRSALGMEGIEYEIMEGFKKYLKDSHQVDLKIMWKEAKSFADTYGTIRNLQQDGTFGASAFSITPERKEAVGFSPPYMSDISVMITSKNIPIVQSAAEFNEVFSKLTAITIKGTTYEQDLIKMKDKGNMSFSIEYIPSNLNILHTIEQRDSAFGFIDLPVYMMVFNNNPSTNVNRQNMFPVKRKGFAIIYPHQSDWSKPMQEYFINENFAPSLEEIMDRYIDIELYHFIEALAIQSNDMVVLLTKEKEIQYKDLLGKTEQIEKEARTRNFLIVFLAVNFFFLLLIIILYKKRSDQKKKIEAQRISIELKNQQLEKRNHHLVTLDEEKNNLIKILAHDLRTPINHVHGLAQVFMLSNPTLPEDQKMIIQRITDASVRLNKMITNILDIDSLENNRVKIFMDDVSITPLISQVVKSFDKQALKKNMELVVMNTSKKNIVIKGDSLFLTQVFENLVSNAIKFSEHGKKIEVRIQDSNGNALISVKDYGPGLTEEDMQMLFKKFQTLSAKPTDGESSTGLGLSIVKKYVELMGGRVWAESQPGKGATFSVEFEKG